jgi:hypothetical protein
MGGFMFVKGQRLCSRFCVLVFLLVLSNILFLGNHRLELMSRHSSYSFMTSALDGGEWSASRPGRAFTPGERTPGTYCTEGWVGPRAGLDTEDRGKIVCACRGSNPGRPARSQTLYCLS